MCAGAECSSACIRAYVHVRLCLCFFLFKHALGHLTHFVFLL
jgi:hypothetical protein